MRRLYLRFLRGASANVFSALGVALVTSVVIIFFIFELLSLTGIITQAYIGLITYLAFPALFIIGLLLIPLGWLLWSRRSGRPIQYLLADRFDEDDLRDDPTGARLAKLALILTVLNLAIFGAASARMLHFMDSAKFCGTACHSVMNPEWVTYRQSPHAHVKCVECHVGEGVGALIDSKINGMWQVISLSFDLYERPIPTPVRNLRPARETCEKCHWPEFFVGNRVKTFAHYGMDSLSTPRYTTLMLKVGSGQRGLDEGIHWHVGKHNEVQYASLEDKREQIVWVEVSENGGKARRFVSQQYSDRESEAGENARVMDCVDCHNRATHIYEDPERAVDDRIAKGLVSRELPFVKRELLGAVVKNYAAGAAEDNIRAEMSAYYLASGAPLASPERFEQAVQTGAAIQERNLHRRMNLDWGSYPNHLGHRDSGGCFRCHNTDLRDEAGQAISMECTLCHSVMALDSPTPYAFLTSDETDTTDSEAAVRAYYKAEMMGN